MYWRVELNTRVNGLMDLEKEMDHKFGLMVQNIKVNGKTIKPMATVSSTTQTEISTKESGSMIKPMVEASTPMPMEPSTMACGKMTNSMARVLSLGLMEHSMRESTMRVRRMAGGSWYLQMAQCMRVTFR